MAGWKAPLFRSASEVPGGGLLRLSSCRDRPDDFDLVVADAVDLVVLVHDRVAVRDDHFEQVADAVSRRGSITSTNPPAAVCQPS